MGSEGSPRNENVYVAVGRDVEESKSTLLWALHNFGGQFRILHVHQPPDAAANKITGDEVNAWRKDESQNVNKILDIYIHICHQAKVEAKKRCFETKDIGMGLVELIEHHNVAKLVMGAAADRHYSNGMTELKSSKAIYVNHHAQPSCQIWFVCNRRLIQRREADIAAVDMATAPPSPSPCASTEFYSMSREISISPNNGILPSYERIEADSSGNESSSSSSSNHHEKDVKNTGEMYEEFERAMKEAENKRQDAFRGLMKRVTASEETAIEAIRKAKAFEKLYNESVWRKETEEILVKEKEGLEARNKQLEEELAIARDQLEKQIASSDHTIRELKKEIDQCHATSRSVDRQCHLSEFSFLEIQRATDNFEPSLMIGECGFGSIFKASLHYTDVAIKLLQSGAERGLVQFKQELEIMSKLRHPNIVTLIGVCSDRYALVYEHLQNGSLEDRLACTDDTPPLPWQTRITIASLVCSTLSFLHSNKPHCYIHGNLKPDNILLDANFAPKLSDFGTARPNPINYRDFPHLDPLGGELPLSPKSDTYSFGVLVLQLLTGRRCALSLVRDVKDALDGGNTSYMALLLDPLVEWPPQLAMKLAQLAVDCCDMDQSRRPDLGLDVGRVLDQMRASIPCQNNHPPDHFLCPILQEVMEDPHVAADGFTYEAEVLMEWFQSGHNTSPMTNLPLPHFNLIPNRTLRSGIQQWLEKH